MTEAYGDLITGQYTVDTAQAEATAHIERYLAPSVSAVRMLQMAGAWPETPMDRVLFAPFGSADWPHFFTAGVGVPAFDNSVDGRVAHRPHRVVPL